MKLLVVGDAATGKTSFCKRTISGVFNDTYKTTVGVDFKIKRLTVDGQKVRLQLWDIMGQERFAGIVRVYYQKTDGVFIVYDLLNQETFDNVLAWKREIDSKVRLPNGDPVPIVLLGNKCDLLERPIEEVQAEMDEFVKQHGFTGGKVISAKSNTNVDDSAAFLAREILKRSKDKKASQLKTGADPDQASTWNFSSSSSFYANGNHQNASCC